MTAHNVQPRTTTTGGRFDFDDGGTYCGGWEDGKAHGHGVCTGPKGQGEYSGSWHFGFEVSGVYTWPSGSIFEGQWQNGKRHGLGVETRNRWVYRGEWTQGMKGRYGVRQSLTSGAKYEGTWANGLQDGYGSESYADGGIYQGQWLRGLRHGYGVRTSAPFGLASLFRPKHIQASTTSLRSEHVDPASERDRKIDDCRGGFVLKTKSDEPPPRRRSLVEKSANLKKSILQGLKLKKQRSTGDIDRKGVSGSVRSTRSVTSSISSGSSHSAITRSSAHTDSNNSFVSQDDVTDANAVETYMGELKNDKRCGFGIAERSDGIKYEGEWYNNKKYGYGVTTFKDGTKEEGKYKNNVLLTTGKKKHLFLLRSTKFRERIDGAVSAAARASQIALQKADIAISRTATARGKAEQADISAVHAREDSDFARLIAQQFAPEFQQSGSDVLKIKQDEHQEKPENNIRRPSTIPSNQQTQQVSHTSYLPQVNVPQENLGSIQSGNIQTEMISSDAITMNIDRYGNRSAQVPGTGNTAVREPPQINQNPVSYLDSSCVPTGNETFSRNPQGSFRNQRRQSFREREGNYSINPGLSEHLDQYGFENTNLNVNSYGSQSAQKFNINKSKTIQSPMNFSHNPIIYTTDYSPDPGTFESMGNADISQGNVPRRSTLPNLHAENFECQTDTILNIISPNLNETSSSTRFANTHQSATENKISDYTPQRTASLYRGAAKKQPPSQLQPSKPAVIKRKKSLPDIQAVTVNAKVMTRAEVSELSSQRREEIRRMQIEAERLRSNPLLYLFNPDVKAWFSKQQLVMLVLFVNISLAIMFFKLLT
ncbi:junctophilin-1-like [Limulus polyphemus]|uniref:Junctophilin-1-like n=1 Tax=Limulus polyphemus TaxID=6850 RepID=A0ABM1SDX8_LIMPO|nr:junctophilin-1-like [Limulus polyphemus]